MYDGATTEDIESQPIAKAKDPRSRDANARRHAGAERAGARRRLAAKMSPPSEKRNGKPTVTARYPSRTGATTATVVKVAVTPANRPARFAGLVSRTSKEFMGSQNSGR